MAEVEYLHVCDLAFAAEGGKQCIIGIFDGITALSFPATHSQLSIAARLRGKPTEVVAAKIEITRPNGDVIAGIPAEITLGPDGSMFVQAQLNGLTFPEPGRYVVKFSSGGRTLHSHSLQLHKAQTLHSAPPGSDPKKFH